MKDGYKFPQGLLFCICDVKPTTWCSPGASRQRKNILSFLVYSRHQKTRNTRRAFPFAIGPLLRIRHRRELNCYRNRGGIFDDDASKVFRFCINIITFSMKSIVLWSLAASVAHVF